MDRVASGIDRGFGGTKFVTRLKRGYFDSFVAPIDEERAIEILKNNSELSIIKEDKSEVHNIIIIKYQDKFYLIGNHVSKIERDYANRDLKRDRNTLNEEILFVAALAVSTDDLEEADIVLTTGLPTEDLDMYKENYKKLITNTFEVILYKSIVKAIKKKITVSKTIIKNQPFGTVFREMGNKMKEGKSEAEVQKTTTGVVDIGYGTTDASCYFGKDLIKGEKINFSLFGMSENVLSIKKKVETRHNCRLTEEQVLKIMETYTVKVRGKDEDVKDIVQETFEKNAELLVSKIRSRWDGTLDTMDEILLTGGGSANKMFAEILKKNFEEKTGWTVRIVDDSQYANAYGFYLGSELFINNSNKK